MERLIDRGASHPEPAYVADQNAASKSYRQQLFDAVDSIAFLLEAEADAAEAGRHLSPAVVEAFRTTRLLDLKVPKELGGYEADNALQFEVIERVAYHSTAAAWCLFIYTDVVAKVAAMVPSAIIDQLWKARGTPVICGGGGMIAGRLVPQEGGYKLSGNWIYGSGITGADYVLVLGAVENGPEEGNRLFCVVPRCSLKSADNWNVVGMRGTGSSDFSAAEVFIPKSMTFLPTAAPLRGGAIFRLGQMGYAAHTLASVAVGGARRALDVLAALAESKARGYSAKKVSLAQRPVFQSFLGRGYTTLTAMRSLMIDVGTRLVSETEALGENPAKTEIESRAAAAFATHAAVQVMGDALRYAAGDGAKSGSIIERTLRDVHMTQTHFYINDSAFELLGRAHMGETNLDAAA